MKASLFALALTAGLVGCGTSSGGSGLSDERPATNLGKSNETALGVDHPPFDAPRKEATPRRLSVDQWRASIPVVFGNDVQGNPIAWTLPNGTPALAAGIARSMGEPDYLATTDEALSPSVAYSKFADDAGRALCTKAMDADAARVDASTRVLVRHVALADTVESNPDAVMKNLRYLKLRFHGVRLKDSDNTTLLPLREVLASAVKGSPSTDTAARSREGWKTVCVALFTAPEFHVY
jgi:hypothetical protein